MMSRRSEARHSADSPHAFTRARALPAVDAGRRAFDELDIPVDAEGTDDLSMCAASLRIIEMRDTLEGAGVGPPSLGSAQGAGKKTPIGSPKDQE